MYGSTRSHSITTGHPRRRGCRTGLALGLVLAAGACASQPATYESLGEVVREPQFVTATVAQLANRPTEYVGKIVTVAGEVNRVLGERWFTIGGEDFGGHEILVLAPSAAPALLNDLADTTRVMNDIVQVTGVVRVFEEDALEREIGGIDLDGDIFDPFDAEPVIVLSRLDLTPRTDVMSAVAGPVTLAVPVLREVEIFVPDRRALAGRSAALYGVRVDSVLGARTFRIGQPGGQRLLVVLNDSAMVGPAAAAGGAPSATSLRAGQNIFVAGVLRPVPANLSTVREAWRLDPAGEAALRNEALYLDAYRVEPLEATRGGR